MIYVFPALWRFIVLSICVYATSCGYFERNHPEDHIRIVAEPWEGESFLELEIINTAEYTDYANVGITVTYFENGRQVGTERLVYWEKVQAKSNALLKATIHPPPPPVHPNKITFTVQAHVVE